MSAEPNASYDDVNTRGLAIVGFVAAVLVFAAILAVQTWFYRLDAAEFERKVVEAPTTAVNNELAQQQAELQRSDKDDVGYTRIPIETAMQQVVAQYSQKSRQNNASESKSPPNAESAKPAASTSSATSDRGDARPDDESNNGGVIPDRKPVRAEKPE